MKMLNTNHPTLIQQYSKIMANIILAISGSVALWISAKISIPFIPVPMTMQTFIVLIIGMSFGWRLAGFTLLLYLFEGAFGLPVFSGTPEKGIGLAYMFGPTGGYLLGFIFASMFVGWLAEKGWNETVISSFFAMFAGLIIIYVFGIVWLASIIGWDKPILAVGLLPFIGGEILKLTLASIAIPLLFKIKRNS